MKEWRHHEGKHQWELGYYDVPMMKFVVLSWVADELMERVAAPEMMAKAIKQKMGSVPPPWEHYTEPPPATVWWGL
jgi:hypothetical protein